MMNWLFFLLASGVVDVSSSVRQVRQCVPGLKDPDSVTCNFMRKDFATSCQVSLDIISSLNTVNIW